MQCYSSFEKGLHDLFSPKKFIQSLFLFDSFQQNLYTKCKIPIVLTCAFSNSNSEFKFFDDRFYFKVAINFKVCMSTTTKFYSNSIPLFIISRMIIFQF